MVVENHKRKLSAPEIAPHCSQSAAPPAFAPLGDGSRSAFLPYKPSVTVLTNLQRGNTQIKSRPYYNEELSFFQLAAKGDLTRDQIQKEHDLNLFDRDVCGLTALMWASAYGQSHTVEDLLKAGAKVNLCNSSGHTALHFAANAGYPEVVKSLLLYGADIDACDERGNTPLNLAAKENHSLTVSLLLNHGADLTHMNLEGDTSYKTAVHRKFPEVQQVLENYMVRLLIGEDSQQSSAD